MTSLSWLRYVFLLLLVAGVAGLFYLSVTRDA